ncbi:hypothetical protein MXB_3794, partial [Myxobolus squamalis]
MGGTTVILSKSILNKIGPNIDECMRTVVSNHEDTELARCILKFSGITCINNKHVKNKFIHGISNIRYLTSKFNIQNLRTIISIHPIRNFKFSVRTKRREHDIDYIKKIEKMNQYLNKEFKLRQNTINNRAVPIFKKKYFRLNSDLIVWTDSNHVDLNERIKINKFIYKKMIKYIILALNNNCI